MTLRPSLANRIVTAFVLMTGAIAGIFSIAIVLTFEYVESHQVSDAMNRYLDFIIDETRDGTPPRISPDFTLYAVPHGHESTLPEWVRSFDPGLHEIDEPDMAYYVLARDYGEYRYVLMLDQEDFERRERLLFSAVFVFFIACVLLAWLLGALLARTVISPVTRLSRQVQHRDQLLSMAPPLAPDYARDEVGKLATAFDETLGLLRQALDRERLFTSDVSHELRTPLMTISSSCELLMTQYPDDERLRTQIERICRASNEMRELVETFLQLARAHNKPGNNGDTPLAAIAEEQIRRWRPEAENKGVQLYIHAESDDSLKYPAALLRAVISNLLRNAIHNTDAGEIRLELRDGGFSLFDTGTGILEKDRENVFQPYFRSSTNPGDGIGIGLSLVQRICHQQGWRIRLENRPGGGCIFEVDLSPP